MNVEWEISNSMKQQNIAKQLDIVLMKEEEETPSQSILSVNQNRFELLIDSLTLSFQFQDKFSAKRIVLSLSLTSIDDSSSHRHNDNSRH